MLGSGHHADVQLQLAFLQIQSLFVSGELVYRPAYRKKAPAGTVAKTAAVFGVGEKTVQATVTDAKNTGRVTDKVEHPPNAPAESQNTREFPVKWSTVPPFPLSAAISPPNQGQRHALAGRPAARKPRMEL